MKELADFTVERLQAFIDKPLDNGFTRDEQMALVRIALAAKTAEPVDISFIEGMEVSVDVSTCDADADHRYFGTVTEVSELDSAEEGYILLVEDAKPNFPAIPDGWIPCAERTPEVNDLVMGLHIEGYLKITKLAPTSGKFHMRDFTHCWEHDDGDSEPEGSITHWQPLPALPTTEK